MLSRFVIALLSRSKHLLISWLQWLSTVILEPKKIKSVIASTFSPSICHEMIGPDAMILLFEYWVSSQLFHSSLSPSSRGSLVPLHFLPLEWYHLHIWGCLYFSRQSWFQLVIQYYVISKDRNVLSDSRATAWPNLIPQKLPLPLSLPCKARSSSKRTRSSSKWWKDGTLFLLSSDIRILPWCLF